MSIGLVSRHRISDAALQAAMEAYCPNISGRPDPDRLRNSLAAALAVEESEAGTLELLRDAATQIDDLQHNFLPTESGEAVLARLRAATT